MRARELSEQEQTLEDLEITQRELQAFMNTPDTDSLLDEALRQRRIAHAKQNLLQILRRVRRNPLIAINVTIAALKGEATRQLNSLAASEARVLTSVRLLREEVRKIDRRIDEIEGLMAEAGRRADALGCAPGRTLRAC